MSAGRADPVTAAVLSNAFSSICEEMGHTMIRTANSGVFVEGRDFSCALVGPDAELVASANFDPSHLAAMALTVEFTLLHFGYDAVREGDVYLVNDPYRGGGHLPDITLIRPLFADGRLLAFAVNRAHHIDIGGMAVAGFPGTARSIYQEGLRIPPVRWYAAGEENTDVIETITLNQRFPSDQLGDFRAQLASALVAETRLTALARRHGHATVLACMDQAKDHAEALVRATIEALPDGTFSFDEFIEDDGATDQPYRIHVAVTVAGDAMTVDYTGTGPQATGPINSSYGNTLGGTFNAVMQLMGPDTPFNHGCFRPVTVVAPRGSLLNPMPPAPCFGGVTEVSIRLIDAVLGALAPVAGDLAGAGSYGTCVNLSGGGFDPERGEPFAFYIFVEGGWGACRWRDGWNCTPNPTSNFNDYPVEWTESELPLRYREARLNRDSGGPGRMRGGVGTVRTIELLCDDVELNGLGERFLVPPFGLEGGGTGACNGLHVRTARDGGWRTVAEALGAVSPSKFHDLRAGRGTWLRVTTGGGGGHGDPFTREPGRVVDDVAMGFVSRDGARRDYGVEVAEREDGSLDHDPRATARLRRQGGGEGARTGAPAETPMRTVRERADRARPRPEAAAELRRVEDLIARGKRQLERRDAADPRWKPGRSLSNPFLNDSALDSWDAHALERWAARHGFDLGSG